MAFSGYIQWKCARPSENIYTWTRVNCLTRKGVLPQQSRCRRSQDAVGHASSSSSSTDDLCSISTSNSLLSVSLLAESLTATIITTLIHLKNGGIILYIGSIFCLKIQTGSTCSHFEAEPLKQHLGLTAPGKGPVKKVCYQHSS